jgi:thiamine-phosphate pyrophosphorylase
MTDKNRFHPPRLLVISSGQQTRGSILDVLKNLCAAGAPWLLLREENLLRDKQRDLAKQLMPHAGQTKISVSDDVEFALQIGAHGIHVSPEADLKTIRAAAKDLIMGVHCHNLTDIAHAQEVGADYITLSPIFLTASKPGYGPALGLEILRAAARDYKIPIMALAGITVNNMAECIDAGAYGIAVMGGIMRAADPAERMRYYRDSLYA